MTKVPKEQMTPDIKISQTRKENHSTEYWNLSGARVQVVWMSLGDFLIILDLLRVGMV